MKPKEVFVTSGFCIAMNLISFGIAYRHGSGELMALSVSAIAVFSLIAVATYFKPKL
jgi:hypothetical protein